MPIFSRDLKLCATAYIRAADEEEAARIFAATFGEGNTADLPTGDAGDFEVSGDSYDDPDLPDVSISPAVTTYGAFDEDSPLMFVEDDPADDEGDD
jgi:hypothetical protein